MNITNHLTTTADIDSAVRDAFHRLADLQAEVAHLQTLGPANATPSYHKDNHGKPKYLWLIYPQKNGERIREYVGSKPEKITAALARVQAHKDLKRTLHQAADIRTRLDLVSRYLAAALRAAEGGEV